MSRVKQIINISNMQCYRVITCTYTLSKCCIDHYSGVQLWLWKHAESI